MARLGWNTTERFWTLSEWGLPDEVNPKTGKPRKVWLPAGLVIPTFVPKDGQREICRMRVRRLAGEPKYVNLRGSAGNPMRWGRVGDRLHDVLVVESELDAMAIARKAGDLVVTVATGSAQARPDLETHKILSETHRILMAFDYDEAGAGQVGWWRKVYGSKVKRWPVPTGKDPGDYCKAGGDLREWVAVGLGQYEKV
jgi:hypothetical protein